MTAPAWEAVLFDFGGTLDGDGIHWSRRFDAAFRALGLSYPPEALDRAFRAAEDAINADPAVSRLDLPGSIRLEAGLMLGALGFPDPAPAEAAARALTLETRGFLARNSDVLRALRGRARLGILSNFTGNLELILSQEGLRDLVDGVFDSAVVGLRKPDPAFFRHALERLGAEPARALMVGDSVDMDLRPARALGMATAWVEGPAPRPTDFRPDLTLASVRDLPGAWGARR
ncbi:MAG TPA: HAD family hydrolase [Candidatus Saccharimonadales bacterium]|nr:HAD family hydrolase [Candidatus Saccharimonadales bacterium]